MRKLVLTLLSALMLTALAGADPTYKDGRITAEFVNADVVYVIKCIAKAINRNVFVGPTVQGTVTISFQDEPAESALQKLFASLTQEYDFKILEHTVVVAAPEKLSEIPDDILDSRRAKEYKPSPAPSADAAAPPLPTLPPGTPIIGTLFRDTLGEFNTESYDYVGETGYREVAKRPLSTFSIDVDTASYANLRRFLNQGTKPPKDAVRIEELVNYFRYDYPEPQGPVPFAVNTELSECPWNADHQLLRIGLQGRRIKEGATPPRNLVFLIDISGSMQSPDKLPLLQRALGLLVKKLDDQDRIAIVVYAGAEGLALPSTSGDQQETIEAVINNLRAGGSTNGAGGITLAYQVARENFKPGAINRVILATDGDFNVGMTDRGSLERLIEQERESGVFLTVLGFGTGNLKDSTMEQLADKGNGNYAYIDSLMEGQKVLVREAGSTLVTIAKDVKLQVEFNPARVGSYRLVGYENRRLEDEDFDNDKKDAGELGAGHSVTALYELVPAGEPGQDQPLRYQSARQPNQAHADELAQVKLRYKLPDEDASRLMAFPIKETLLAFDQASLDHRFATAVAAFGMVMRESEHKGSAELGKVASWASESVGRDRSGDRHEFVRLVELARSLELDRAAR